MHSCITDRYTHTAHRPQTVAPLVASPQKTPLPFARARFTSLAQRFSREATGTRARIHEQETRRRTIPSRETLLSLRAASREQYILQTASGGTRGTSRGESFQPAGTQDGARRRPGVQSRHFTPAAGE